MVRVIHRLSPMLNLVYVSLLVILLVVFGYFLISMYSLVFVLIFGVSAFAWALIVAEANRGYSWEIDSAGFKALVGERTIMIIPLKEIERLNVKGSLEHGRISLSVIDKSGARRIDVESGLELTVADIRLLYEASAYYLRTFDAQVSNPFDWTAKPLLTRETLTEGGYRKTILETLPHVPFSMIFGGVEAIAAGTTRRLDIALFFGVALTASGIVLFVVMLVRKKRRRKKPAR